MLGTVVNALAIVAGGLVGRIRAKQPEVAHRAAAALGLGDVGDDPAGHRHGVVGVALVVARQQRHVDGRLGARF